MSTTPPIPRLRTRLIERGPALAEVCTWLRKPDVGLVTLTGPAGVGKTRLASEVAHRLAMDGGPFPDGVTFVDLSGLDRPSGLLPTIAQALDLWREGGQSARPVLESFLAGRRAMLVLDNFEHVLDATPALVELLRACDGLKVLLTSRVVTRVPEERVFPVAPLPVPEPGDDRDPEAVARHGSVQLFLDRARARRPSFQLHAGNAADVAEICRHLDGLPLAIELAASQVALMSPASMLERLTAPGTVADGGALPELDATLARTLAWSASLLSAGARRLFPRLAVFAPGWSLEAVEGVCAGSGIGRADIATILGELLDASLVTEVAGASNAPDARSWRLLETVGAFAARQLASDPEHRRVLEDAHAAYYLAWMADMGPRLVGPGQLSALARIETAFDNVQRAWRRAVSEAEPDWRRLAAATDAMWTFMAVRGRHAEGLELFATARRAVAGQSGRGSSVVLGRMLRAEAASRFRMGQLAASHHLLDRSLAILRRHGEEREVAFALNMLAATVHLEGDDTKERALLEESVALARSVGDRWLCAYSLNDLSLVLHLAGAGTEAETAVNEAIAIHTELDDRRGLAFDLQNLGIFATTRGDLDAAEALHARSLDLRASLADRWGVASSTLELGAIARKRGALERAKGLLLQSLLDGEGARALPLMLEALNELAEVRWGEGRATSARRLAAPLQGHPGLRLRPWGGEARSVGQPPDATGAAHEPVGDPCGAVEALAAELHEVAAELAPEGPQRVSPERLSAIAQLVHASDAPGTPEGTETAVAARHTAENTKEEAALPPFTRRETEIVRWVARGAANRDIAERLGISVRTVERHVSTIYEKIGVRGSGARAAVTAYAFEHGLLA